MLDVVLKPGFLDHVKHAELLFRQRLAALKDRYPTVIAEVRGEGLLIGLKAAIPNGELADAARNEKLLTVGAGENVVRLLPPLIVTDAEITDAMDRLDRACAAIVKSQQSASSKQGAAG